MRTLIIGCLLVAVTLIVQALPAAAQTPEKTIAIKVYFVDHFESDGVINARDLFPVDRTISATDPVRGAIVALMDGPTPQEMDQLRLFPASDYIEIVAIKLRKNVVRIDLSANDLPLVDPPSIRILRLAIEKTLRQFKTHRKVELCLNGVLNFDRKNRKAAVIKCRF